MKKRVKGGIEKHYCDKCGKLIYDHIPKEPTIKLFGMYIPEFSMKKHSEFRMVWGNKKRGIKAGEYCLKCHNDMYAE